MTARYAFYISDSTGITSQTLGNALLPMFKDTEFTKVHLPYTDTLDKADEVVRKINEAEQQTGMKPLIFDTVMNPDIRERIASSNGFSIDIIGTFLPSLEKELGAVSSYQVGQSHDNPAGERALKRMDAVNFALDNDDGMKTRYYGDADVILIGVSRSAKTPTCLYIAMQHGIFAANYPLTEEDFEKGELPQCLRDHKSKLMALTIEPSRLAAIREQRRSSSRYASLKQCEWEIKEAQLMYRKWGIPVVNSTAISVEEIATKIIVEKQLQRRL
jgi:regulator of PEP synthase PpsR (kinase-PPPase family)